MASVSLSRVTKSFGAHEVLHGIDLEIAAGEFVVFVGPSGCGKSTMLRVIAGLEEITSGELRIGGELANRIPPGERGIAMVFQSYALYPHMSVYDNMAFGLKLKGMDKGEIDRRVRRAADMLQLSPYLDRRPRSLSGGQRQRVAIGRAVTRDPLVFLFDEPLSNLDAALRVATRIEIANLSTAMPGTTMIYVTHDQVEAMTLADRIVVFNDGRIEQVGTPLELYERPRNMFVARFIGSPAMNVLPVVIEGPADGPVLRHGQGTIPADAFALAADDIGRSAWLGVRPEHAEIVDAGGGVMAGRVLFAEKLGELTILHVDVGAADPFVAKVAGTATATRGDPVGVRFIPERSNLFSEQQLAYERTK
ncbi:ABC transporter ATP-binding protein [Pleomorphomonas carboxyditropha]|uniref:ABC transporter ATP-binding protein n=1 Tax=Pleomorphomonas carboxyditropha TaxID=2023338 RepID=A0A2G9WTQ9_9HYPH|nr:sn-glycerol-3-phosphate ABC transporter ATP-binding protein UgpC [Pleomorphomonas carboxyditropha]PIO98075.1 ABC transporter ATP-binding protein [Pleomorphomonas carboxyditropha]